MKRSDYPRAAKLAALAERYGIAIRDSIQACENSAEEDLHLYLFFDEANEKPEPIRRWCAVTSSGELTYLYPNWDTRSDAESRTVSYVDDDIYAESPLAVVDLDGYGPAGDIYPLEKVVAVFSAHPKDMARLVDS